VFADFIFFGCFVYFVCLCFILIVHWIHIEPLSRSSVLEYFYSTRCV